MPLYEGDVSQFTDRWVELAVRVTGSGPLPRPASVEVRLDDVDPVLQTDVTFRIDPWEVESTSSDLVVKYTQRSGTDSQDPAADLGARLFEPVFGGPAASLYARATERSGGRGRAGLCVRLHLDPPFVGLPWELLFDRTLYRGFLALAGQTSILRASPRTGPAQEPRPRSGPGTLRFLAPRDEPLFDLQNPDMAPLFGERSSFQDDAGELVDLISGGDHDVVHICGRGVAQTRGALPTLVLGGAAQGSGLLSPRELLYAVKRGRPRVVVLAGPRTDALADELAAGVPVVLGVRGDISPSALSAFYHGFYATLLGGAPLPAAVASGREQIAFQHPGDRSWAAVTAYAAHLGPLVDTSRPAPASNREAASQAGSGTPQEDADPVRSLHQRRLALAEQSLRELDKQWRPVGDRKPQVIVDQYRELEGAVAAERAALQALEGGSA
jgi:hypothetical protein